LKIQLQKELGWRPSEPLVEGMKKTLEWISEQMGVSYNKA